MKIKHRNKPLTVDSVRSGAAKAARGLAAFLRAVGGTAHGAGAAAKAISRGDSFTGQAAQVVGGDLLQASDALEAAASVISGQVVVVEATDAPPTNDDTPPGRRPRKSA